jgi:hypothetical protein
MILQVQDILRDAMGLIGVIEIDESPTSSEMAYALRTANVMLDSWSSQRLLLRSTTPLTIPLTAGKASYTVAPSITADVNAQKPIKIISAYLQDGISGNINDNLEVIEYSTYNSLEDKDVAFGQPIYVAYDPGMTQQAVQAGTVYVYFTPDRSYVLKLECDAYLTEFVNLTDSVTLEPAYYEALIYGLAARLFRKYNTAQASIPQDIVGLASSSLTHLKTMNSVQVIAAMEFPGKASNWNVYTDGFQ